MHSRLSGSGHDLVRAEQDFPSVFAPKTAHLRRDAVETGKPGHEVFRPAGGEEKTSKEEKRNTNTRASHEKGQRKKRKKIKMCEVCL